MQWPCRCCEDTASSDQVVIVASGPVLDGPATPYTLVSSGPVYDGPSSLWDIQQDCWRIEPRPGSHREHSLNVVDGKLRTDSRCSTS